MPFDTLIVSALIISAFVVFGCVLHWGDRRTRDLSPSAEGVKTKRQLQPWVTRGVDYARTLPPK